MKMAIDAMDTELLMMDALDGTISPASRARLEAYFVANPEERAAFEHMLKLDADMRATPSAPLPRDFSQNIMAVVHTIAIARPLKTRHMAFIVTVNSVLIALAWTVGIVLTIGLFGLMIPVEAIHPVAAFVRGVFTSVSDIYNVFVVFSRTLLLQPVVWIVCAITCGIVALWLGVMVNVFKPSRRFAAR